MAGRVAGVGRDQRAGALDLEFEEVVRVRDHDAGLVDDAGGDKSQVVSGEIDRQGRPVGLSGGNRLGFRPARAVLVGDHLQGAGFIDDIVPDDAVAFLGFAAHGTAVDKEFRLVAGGVYMDGSHLSFAAGPRPVRQDVDHGQFRTPAGLIDPVAVLRETGQVDDAEVRAPGGKGNVGDDLSPARDHLLEGLALFLGVEVGQHGRVHVEGRRLAQVVIAGPYELAGAFGHDVFILPLVVGLGGPSGGVQVVGAHLERRLHRPPLALFLLHGETVIPARGDAGGRFRTEHRLAGMVLHELGVLMRLVVEAVHV